MYTQIFISGEHQSVSELANALSTYNSFTKDEMFGNKSIFFKTKEDAKKALREARKKFRAENEYTDYVAGKSLSYDAGYARIIDNADITDEIKDLLK